MEKLKKIFYDPKQGLVSVKKLYEKTKDLELGLTFKQVNDFYKAQSINQVLKPIRKPKEFNSYRALYPGHIFQMDIIVYDRYTYHNYKYILVVIDIYSRYLDAKPMTNRKLSTIIEKFEEIIKDMGAPYEIQCDNEFNKKDFIEVLDDYDIKYRFSDPSEQHKNPIVERSNGTLALLLQKIRITTKRYDWYNYLNDALENYNNTIHSTTDNKPIDIYSGKKINEQDYNNVKNKFSIGDKVRIIKKKIVFSKGDVIKASKEKYIIEGINKNRIKLNGKTTTFKPYELIKITDGEDDIIEPETQTASNKIKHMYKRTGIDQNSILNTKRNK
jgi:hypothetical protein